MKAKVMSLMVFILLVAGSLSAQVEQKTMGEKVKKPRMTEEEMIQKQTERMSAALLLDDATSAKFAPVYQQYLKDMRDIRKEARQNCPAEGAQCRKAEKKALTDAEIEARIEQRFDRCRKMLDTREKYYKEFKKMLTAKQIEKIFKQAPCQGGHRIHQFGHKQMPMAKGQLPMHRQNCPLQK